MILSHLSKLHKMFASLKTKFVDYKEGPPENLFLNERELAVPENYELMKVKAVGINRAECLHRVGRYPIKNEAERFIGLEASGEVIDPKTGYKCFDLVKRNMMESLFCLEVHILNMLLFLIPM